MSRGERIALAFLAVAGGLFLAAQLGARLAFSQRAERNEQTPRSQRKTLSTLEAPEAAPPPVGTLRVEPFERTPGAAQPEDDAGLSATDTETLRAENTELKERMNALLNWILGNFRGKYPLPEEYLSRMRVDPMREDFTLHPDMIALLDLTPEETEMLDDALQVGEGWLRAVEEATIQVREPNDAKVVLSIPPFQETGAVMREDLYGALKATLGEDRFDRFLAFSEENLSANFNYFGEASRTMIFELADDDTYPPRLVIRDAMIVPDGEDAHRIEAKESTVTNLPVKYWAYLSWLPDYVGQYATP